MCHKIKILVSLLSISSILMLIVSCREKIPEGPPRVQVMEAVLYTPFDRNVFPQPTNYLNRYQKPNDLSTDEWNYLTDSDIRFRIKVNNIFDETIDGLKWIEVKLNLWSTNYPNISRTLTYRNFKEDTSLIVLHPGKTYYVYTADSLIWDQTDKNGKSIHKLNPYHVFNVFLDSTFNRQKNEWEYFCDTTYTVIVDTVVAFDVPIKMKAQAEVKIFKNYEPIKTNIFYFTIAYIFPGLFSKHKCNPGSPG